MPTQLSSDSCWSEIKMLEDRLAQDPSSYCFAQLAEVYIRSGLLDDALATARKGIARYPLFVAGQMVLARACYQKGLVDECQRALETVTAAMPENAEAQRLLSSIYSSAGRKNDAVMALKTLLFFNPEHASARLELDTLQQAVSAIAEDDDLELIEFTEDDIIDDLEEITEEDAHHAEVRHETLKKPEEPEPDLLVDRVKPVNVVVDDPWNGLDIPAAEDTPAEIAEKEETPAANDLESVWAFHGNTAAYDDNQAASAVPDEPELPAGISLSEPPLQESVPEQEPAPESVPNYEIHAEPEPAPESVQNYEIPAEPEPETDLSVQADLTTVSGLVDAPADLPVNGTADRRVVILEGWLENIRRIRACR